MGPAAGSRGVTGAETVRVWLLGSFRVSVGARTIQDDAWRRRKAAALMKLLALASDHRLHREQAMETLWPNLGRKAASNNLRQAIHVARKALHPVTGSRYLESENELLVLCPGGNLWVDIEAFEEAAAAARRERSPAAYRVAIELYAGDLLPEDRYEEWAEPPREELRSLHLALLFELAGLYEEYGEYEPAVEVLRRVVAEEPTNEEAHADLMRLHALSGRLGQAFSQYERLREALSERLGAEPSAAVRRLRDEMAAGRFSPSQTPHTGPSREPLNASKHNLPAQRTSFVGRGREMVEVQRGLAMTRLLTLTGAGGCGKTRLALEVARDLVGSYPDGVWLVELAGLSEGALVPQAVAGALGVKEQPGQVLTDTLIDALRGKDMLLILDNCEHLVQDAARLVDALLDACPGLRVLATSREVLKVVGETNRPVLPLKVPARRRGLTVADLERSESARLFLDRARHRNPSFVLMPENALVVAEVCRGLAGMPLAIELAAARVGTLSLDQIARKLKDSLKLLTDGGRTTVPRQRTLRGALDWSYELLREQERVLFRRLSVFAGGWTLESAEVVAPGEGVAHHDLVDLLSGLVDKSLLVVEATEESRVRYRLLEPIRQYVREKLEESGEAEAVRRRHASFFLALAEEAGAAWTGSEEGAWLDRIEAEHDNIRAVFSWSLVGGDPDHGLRMAVALWWFYHVRGYHSEGTTWLEGALAKDGAANPTARAGALIGLGRMLSDREDFMRAEECLEEALALYERLGDLGGVAEALNALGWVTFQEGDDPTRAKVLLEESLAAARESGDRRVIPSVLNGLAHIAIENVAFELARKLWGEAVLLSRDQGRASVTSSILFNLGYMELAARDVARATDLFAEALSLSQELGHKSLVAGCLLGLGMAATLQGEPRRAEALIKEGLEINLELESKSAIAEFLEGLAEAAGALGQDLRAARLWGAAAALRRTLDWPWWTAERRLHEPLLQAARSHLEEAAWEEAFAEGEAMGLEEVVDYAMYEDDATTPTSQSPDELEDQAQPPSLSRREEEIAALVAQGLSNRQIATELSISEHTAATHVRRILKKLGLKSRAQIGSWLTEQRSS